MYQPDIPGRLTASQRRVCLEEIVALLTRARDLGHAWAATDAAGAASEDDYSIVFNSVCLAHALRDAESAAWALRHSTPSSNEVHV